MSEEEQKATKKATSKGRITSKKTREMKNSGTSETPRSKSKRGKKPVDSSDNLPYLPGIKEAQADYTTGTPIKPPDACRFIQVEKGNLLTYLAYGLIYPVNLEDREIVKTQSRARDPQSLCPDALVISPGFLRNAEEDQVLIEVALSREEEDRLTKVGVHCLLAQPLPVSRIAAVYTLTEKARNELLASAKTFSDAPMPVELVNDAPERLKASCLEPELAGADVPQLVGGLTEQKKTYNRMLGMFAFMRNTEKYFSGRTHRYSDFSRGYIPTLTKLNPAIQTPPLSDEDRKAGEFYSGLLKGTPTDPFFAPIMEVVKEGRNFDRDAVENIIAAHKRSLSPLAADTVKTAFAELFEDGFKQCIRILGQATGVWNYTILAILNRFHKRGSNDKLNIKRAFPDTISDSKRAEIALAILGQYYGYASLPKDEMIDAIEPVLAPVVGRNHAIKYGLKETLDRITIETVFQFAWNGTAVDSLFDYLPRVPKESAAKPFGVDETITDESYSIVGTRVRVFKVSDEAERLSGLIRDTYKQGKRPFYLAMYIACRAPQAVKAVHIRADMQVEIDVDLGRIIGSIPKLAQTDGAEIRACIDADRMHVFQADKK